MPASKHSKESNSEVVPRKHKQKTTRCNTKDSSECPCSSKTIGAILDNHKKAEPLCEKDGIQQQQLQQVLNCIQAQSSGQANIGNICNNCVSMAKNYLILEQILCSLKANKKDCKMCSSALKYIKLINRSINKVYRDSTEFQMAVEEALKLDSPNGVYSIGYIPTKERLYSQLLRKLHRKRIKIQSFHQDLSKKEASIVNPQLAIKFVTVPRKHPKKCKRNVAGSVRKLHEDLSKRQTNKTCDESIRKQVKSIQKSNEKNPKIRIVQVKRPRLLAGLNPTRWIFHKRVIVSKPKKGKSIVKKKGATGLIRASKCKPELQELNT